MGHPHRFTSDLGRAHLVHSISILVDHDEELLQFLFSHKEPALRRPAKNLIQDSRDYSLPEQLLVRVALDFWNGRGGARLADLFGEWDGVLWLRFVRALCHLEEIEADARDALIVANEEPFMAPVASRPEKKGQGC